MIILALLAYVCEAYVGVMPSVALFRHYFAPHIGRSRWIFGCASFALRSEAKHQFLTMVLDYGLREWRYNWYYIGANDISPHLAMSFASAECLAHSWKLSP